MLEYFGNNYVYLNMISFCCCNPGFYRIFDCISQLNAFPVISSGFPRGLLPLNDCVLGHLYTVKKA